jgi:CRISPR/Cas system Type II protein with McrA/HNH and RuvC-like nuclease domain
MGIVYTKKKFNCKTCGRWMDDRRRAHHVRQHKVAKELADEKRGIEPKAKTERGRLRLTAKRSLSLVKVCAYCKQEGTFHRGPDGLFWHMDHIIPWSVGQIESLENYVKACHTCNVKKRNTVKYPSGDTMTAAHLTFQGTGLYRRLWEQKAFGKSVS